METLAHLPLLYDWRFGALFGASAAGFVLQWFVAPFWPEHGVLARPGVVWPGAVLVAILGAVVFTALWLDLSATVVGPEW